MGIGLEGRQLAVATDRRDGERDIATKCIFGTSDESIRSRLHLECAGDRSEVPKPHLASVIARIEPGAVNAEQQRADRVRMPEQSIAQGPRVGIPDLNLATATG